jgi:ribonuclease HII
MAEHPPLFISYSNTLIEAGCDEAGRGCLAGPVFAAAVILPMDFNEPALNDSKKLTEKKRYELREIIEQKALSFSVSSVDHEEIDELNILNASIKAMHQAIQKLKIKPQLLLIDGNRFKRYRSIPHKTIIKGDSLYLSIAAASVLAKTYRDDYMLKLHEQFPSYHWDKNKGYPTSDHYAAIAKNGICKLHRKTFNLNPQIKLNF